MADPAFVLLGHPIEGVGADGAEFGQRGVQDDEVEIVAAVDPYADEEGEVGDGDGGVEVGADFGGLSKQRLLANVTEVMSNLDSRQGRSH